MKDVSQSAKKFTEGVTQYIRQGGKLRASMPKVESLFEKLSTESYKEKQAVVTSAVVLNDGEKQEIEGEIHRILNKSFRFEYKVKPSVIGGFRIRIGDWILDTTIKHQLEILQKELQV